MKAPFSCKIVQVCFGLLAFIYCCLYLSIFFGGYFLLELKLMHENITNNFFQDDEYAVRVFRRIASHLAGGVLKRNGAVWRPTSSEGEDLFLTIVSVS